MNVEYSKKKPLSLQEHFVELRIRILRSFLSLIPFFVICWFFSDDLLNILRQPLKPFLKSTGGGLIFTAPLDQFMAHLQISFFASVFLSSPYWLAQLWCFFSPGLYKKEKKLFIFFWFMGLVLFLLGTCFAYFVVFPIMFSLLMNFGSGVDQPFITIKNYLSFITRFIFILGLVFEMPLILVFLCRGGMLSSGFLKKYRRQAILILSILSAFITPPDILSLFLLLLPLIGLYELSIWLTGFFEVKRA